MNLLLALALARPEAQLVVWRLGDAQAHERLRLKGRQLVSKQLVEGAQAFRRQLDGIGHATSNLLQSGLHRHARVGLGIDAATVKVGQVVLVQMLLQVIRGTFVYLKGGG